MLFRCCLLGGSSETELLFVCDSHCTTELLVCTRLLDCRVTLSLRHGTGYSCTCTVYSTGFLDARDGSRQLMSVLTVRVREKYETIDSTCVARGNVHNPPWPTIPHSSRAMHDNDQAHTTSHSTVLSCTVFGSSVLCTLAGSWPTASARALFRRYAHMHGHMRVGLCAARAHTRVATRPLRWACSCTCSGTRDIYHARPDRPMSMTRPRPRNPS